MCLQWGHRLSAMETVAIGAVGVPLLKPSMGPPPFSDGNSEGSAAVSQLWPPSMGPPPFSDGNVRGSTCGCVACIPFNGATAFQRWKPPRTAEVMSVVPSLQWGHRLSAMETWSTRSHRRWLRWSFNGATAFQRWKLGSLLVIRLAKSSFNGATAFQRWKPEHRAYAQGAQFPPSMGPPPFSDGNWSNCSRMQA